MTISIKGINKATLLAELYNHSKPLGLGLLHYTPEDITPSQAQTLLDRLEAHKRPLFFDYLQGRCMKIDLTEDHFEERFYDHNNGQGMALQCVELARTSNTQKNTE